MKQNIWNTTKTKLDNAMNIALADVRFPGQVCIRRLVCPMLGFATLCHRFGTYSP